jgi:hypothetical protein
MTDKVTQKPLQVTRDSPEGQGGGYIVVPRDQLEEVQRLLDDHNIAYWVSPDSVSWDHGPYLSIINLSFRVDPAKVQTILDAA